MLFVERKRKGLMLMCGLGLVQSAIRFAFPADRKSVV
jgi:hypothetical protein